MPKEILFLVEESPEGGYEAQAPGYSIYTQAEALDEIRLPALALGQAVVSFTSLARPLLVAIDPTPSRLLMVE